MAVDARGSSSIRSRSSGCTAGPNRVKSPIRTGQTSRTMQLKLKNIRSPSSMLVP
jgi:hypothetical protein